MKYTLTVAATMASLLLVMPQSSHAARVKDRAEAWDPPRIVELDEGEELPTAA